MKSKNGKFYNHPMIWNLWQGDVLDKNETRHKKK